MILLLLLSFLILFQIYLKPIYTFTYSTAKYQIFNMDHSMKCVTYDETLWYISHVSTATPVYSTADDVSVKEL